MYAPLSSVASTCSYLTQRFTSTSSHPARSAVIPLLLVSRVAAFSCQSISYTTCADRIVHWYDPDDGQICDPHDCGGGRAPPRKDVPGCAMYTGTETLKTEPSYLPCWTPSNAAAISTKGSVESSSSSSSSSAVEATPTDTSVVANVQESRTGSSGPPSITTSVASSTTVSYGTLSSTGATPSTTLPATTSTTTAPSGTTLLGDGAPSPASSSTHSVQTADAGKLIGGSKLARAVGIAGVFALL
ncbi:hypothetical protein NOR_04814 [Metarhizium rileyi]|uniref:Siderophore biosynthesis enzyme n=1 Tax=Metarhizium rileyi (strain RCEF 4871) TaxID=1649241 RepID=A0A162JIY0_METRR|nr:hypothetical protein NOR_04814 [Metarhizium rileyi RCEF 4871]